MEAKRLSRQLRSIASHLSRQDQSIDSEVLFEVIAGHERDLAMLFLDNVEHLGMITRDPFICIPKMCEFFDVVLKDLPPTALVFDKSTSLGIRRVEVSDPQKRLAHFLRYANWLGNLIEETADYVDRIAKPGRVTDESNEKTLVIAEFKRLQAEGTDDTKWGSVKSFVSIQRTFPQLKLTIKEIENIVKAHITDEKRKNPTI